MKNYFKLAATVLLCCAIATGCSKTKVDEPEEEPTPDPVIPTLTMGEVVEGETSATFTLSVKDADKVSYTYYAVDSRPE